jgi:hypothetical protein
MRLEWGSRSETLNLGQHGSSRCEKCGADRPSNLVLRYRVEYILHPTFLRVSEREYLGVCQACGQGRRLDPHNVERTLGKNPIPWEHRYGFALGMALIVLVFVLVRLAMWLGAPSRR